MAVVVRFWQDVWGLSRSKEKIGKRSKGKRRLRKNKDTMGDHSDDTVMAARLTVTFLFLYSLTFINVLRCKKKYGRLAKEAGKKFDRYNTPDMHNADRLNANFLEWSPMFLGLLWSLAATSNLSTAAIVAAWTYVGLRALYIGLVFTYGVSSNGMNRSLWISTFPAYFCLNVMFLQAIISLFFWRVAYHNVTVFLVYTVFLCIQSYHFPNSCWTI